MINLYVKFIFWLMNAFNVMFFGSLENHLVVTFVTTSAICAMFLLLEKFTRLVSLTAQGSPVDWLILMCAVVLHASPNFIAWIIGTIFLVALYFFVRRKDEPRGENSTISNLKEKIRNSSILN